MLTLLGERLRSSLNRFFYYRHLPRQANQARITAELPCQLQRAAHAESFQSIGTTDVYYSPRGGATAAVVAEIADAKSEILRQAYSFTSAPIAKALVDAKKRGVRIVAVLDKSQRREKYTAADYLAHAGIPTYIDAVHAIAHNKIIIIDRSTLLTGSFNFTKAAEEKNAENLLILKGNKALAERYA